MTKRSRKQPGPRLRKTSRQTSRTRTAAQREPFWRPDSRARVRAFLPELAASIVTATSFTSAISMSDGTNVGAFIFTAFVLQALLQTALYVCTYLVSNLTIACSSWFLLSLTLPLWSWLPTPLAFLDSASSEYAPVCAMAGAVLFYATRSRGALVLAIIEMLAISAMDASSPETFVLRMVGLCGLATLLIMRSSPTRITIVHGAKPEQVTKAPDGASADGASPLFAQVGAVAASVCAICAALVIAGGLVTWQGFGASATSTSSATQATQSATPDGTHADGGTGDAASAGDAASVGDDARNDVGTSAQDGDLATQSGVPARSVRDAHAADFALPIALLVLLSAIGVPVLVRLAMRALARRSIAREPRPADRAARIYVGILRRLEAAGIERNEAETPREFLAHNETGLEELGGLAGIDLEAWATLTNVYEKTRYAELDVTESELELCWRLYDILPVCTRRLIGWPRYLAGAFWRL